MKILFAEFLFILDERRKTNRMKKCMSVDLNHNHWYYVSMFYHWATWTTSRSVLLMLISWQNCSCNIQWKILMSYQPWTNMRESSLDEIEYTECFISSCKLQKFIKEELFLEKKLFGEYDQRGIGFFLRIKRYYKSKL